MEKPPIDVIIWKLKAVGFKEWEVFTNIETHYGHYFELKRYGLLFRVEIRKGGNGSQCLLSIEDDDKTFRIEYMQSGSEYEKVHKFYKELQDDIEHRQEKEATEKLNFILSEQKKGGSNLEHMVSRLKELGVLAWRPGTFFNRESKYPVLIAKDSGITFCITKKFGITGWKYELEVKYEKESSKKVKYAKPDKKRAKKLVSELYENIYKELKENKEKEFKEKLNSFLTN